MPKGSSISLFTLIGVLCAFLTGAPALDETKYPDGKGQWVRADGANAAPWDARKPSAHKPDAHKLWELGQQPPLAPQYQAPFEANLKQLAASVKAGDPTTSRAMPHVMMAIHPMEIVVMRDTTCIMIETFPTLRRIFTDGRAWPNERPRSTMADRRPTLLAPIAS
jgi:hypothetical protein